MASNSSYVFNAQNIGIKFSINNGTSTTLTGTDASSNWVPTNSPIVFDPLNQQAGELGWGSNTVKFSPSLGQWTPQAFTFQLSGSLNPSTQILIYLFWQSEAVFAIEVLANGQLVYSGNQAAATAMPAEHKR